MSEKFDYPRRSRVDAICASFEAEITKLIEEGAVTRADIRIFLDIDGVMMDREFQHPPLKILNSDEKEARRLRHALENLVAADFHEQRSGNKINEALGGAFEALAVNQSAPWAAWLKRNTG